MLLPDRATKTRSPAARLRLHGRLSIFPDDLHRGRRAIFVGHEAVDLVLAQLLRSATDTRLAVIAYCFMPDHLHLLVEGSSADARLAEFVRSFKQRSAFHWKRTFGGGLWQRSYFDRVLPSDESTIEVARYVLANPVRAGMVVRVEDYPFLGSLTMSIQDLFYSVSTD